ncbi:hypothetical protein [Devosia sp.]|uniref:hypothetical protein n=1 Tax=Devosia sp. TaxID=1871048 RepID=UPI003263A4E2
MFRLSMLGVSLVLAATLIAPALAASEEEVMDQIENLQGDSVGFGEFFGKLQDAFLLDDHASFADLVAFPITIHANGETYDVDTADTFTENFDSLLAPQTQEAIRSQDFKDLFVNAEGVMIADGAVWMSNICDNDACSKTYWAVTAINN